MTSPSLIRNDLRLGFGCSGALGKRWFSEKKAARILQAAVEGGVTHFDTAGFYGEAESRLGRIAKALPQNQLLISTKTGTKSGKDGVAGKDFSRGAIETDIDASLMRLGRDYLDLVYLHGPTSEQLAEAAPVLSGLKEQGKIKYAGVCGEGGYLDEAAEHPAVDVVMGAYNFLRRDHEPVFAKAKTNGKGVVAIAPLAQGLYRKDFFLPRSLADGWHLARALLNKGPELQKARAAAGALEEPGWTPAGLALAFVLANENIDVAITTTTKLAHLKSSLEAAATPLQQAALKRLRSLGSAS